MGRNGSERWRSSPVLRLKFDQAFGQRERARAAFATDGRFPNVTGVGLTLDNLTITFHGSRVGEEQLSEMFGARTKCTFGDHGGFGNLPACHDTELVCFDDPCRVRTYVALALKPSIYQPCFRVKITPRREELLSGELPHFGVIGTDDVKRCSSGNENLCCVSLANGAVSRVEQADPGTDILRGEMANSEGPVLT